jgi:hypothetical protein
MKDTTNKKTERSKIDLAVIRALVASGITTPAIIAEHVTCNLRTIGTHLKAISTELTNKADKSTLFNVFATTKVDLLQERDKQFKSLTNETSALSEALEDHEVGSRDWLAIHKQLLSTRSELNKISGLQMALEVAKAGAMKNLDKQDEPVKPLKPRYVSYMPSPNPPRIANVEV